MKGTDFYVNVPLSLILNVSDRDFKVWAVLCSFHEWEWKDGKPTVSKPGSCFPSLRAIAERAHCSVDTVSRSLKHLEALGYVVRIHRFHDDGGKAANEYRLIANPE